MGKVHGNKVRVESIACQGGGGPVLGGKKRKKGLTELKG